MTDPAPGVALVSGSSGSLGQAIVAHLLDRRWSVVGVDRTSPESPDSDRLRSLQADLATQESIEETVSRAKACFGRIDLLVNAIGLIHSEPVLRLQGGRLAAHSRVSWDTVIQANLTIPVLLAASVAAQMARQRAHGVIVHISSVSARGNEGQVAYAAAKAGLEAATKTMARELGPLGIRVNAVAPGFVDTASTRAALPAERLEKLQAATALKRLGRASEVAEAIEFCWSNSFVTGTVIAVDGGIVL